MLRYVRQVKDKFSNNCNTSLFDINKGQCNKKQLLSEATKLFNFSSSGRNSYYFVVQSENFKGTVCKSTTAEQAGNDDFKKKYGYNRLNSKCHGFLNALQWSSALICGWYASQLLCLNHRNRNLSFDSSKCYYSKYLLNTTRAIHTNVRHLLKPSQSEDGGVHPLPELSQAPTCFESDEIGGKRITPKKTKAWEFYNELHEFYHGNFTANPFQPFAGSDHFGRPYEAIVYRVNNGEQEEPSINTAKVVIEEDHTEKIVEQNVAPVKKLPEQVQDTKINDAYENLLNVIGEIEFQLGVHSLKAQNYANAVSHFKQGSNHNHPGALFNLGLCYEQGLSVKKDLFMAMKLYEMAATKGHPKAAYNLGVFYARGIGGVDKNVRMARKYFHQAASMGQQDAINALGLNAIKEEPQRIEFDLKVPKDRAIMKQEIAVT